MGELKCQYHPTVPEYHDWVIRQLVGVVAPNATAVVTWMIGRWVDEHEDNWLAKKGLTYSRFQEELSRGPRAGAGVSKVLSYEAGKPIAKGEEDSDANKV